MTGSNGSAPNDGIDAAQAAIQTALDVELEKMTMLTRELADVKGKVVRYQRALTALDDSPPEEGAATKRKGVPKRWTVSEKMFARISEVVETQFGTEDDFTIKQLADKVGVAHETAKQAVEQMREQQMVRVKVAAAPGRALVVRRMPA